MKRICLVALTLLVSVLSYSQIGYQITLLNNATGEPRANEVVTVTVKITDSAGKTICEQTQTESTNDFGLLSLTVGNNETFANADMTNLPFYVEASTDGRLIGKSQILSVPVAEYAKRTGLLTKEYLCSKVWTYTYRSSWNSITDKITFYNNNTYKRVETVVQYGDEPGTWTNYENGIYEIEGSSICFLVIKGLYGNENDDPSFEVYHYFDYLKGFIKESNCDVYR